MSQALIGNKHSAFLAAQRVHILDVKSAWELACESSGVPGDTNFFGGDTDTPEWVEYNCLMTNYLGFCKDYEKTGKL